ncbi:hypothetical protein [Caulobacter rhizosphaerae]|uniref:hypothetical protein n=1 Tax=Caulobacter rhizosphaerae TaxID=2010972 RepID=UPI0013D64C41|nr:hypothetical protein [Caulobacter rhizosphaerae]GGL48098.1 hypothetical protein GCM10010983_51840 [Caulobacter rhizosphaerae]
MAATRRFAEDTKVPVSRSQDEAKAMLRKMNADMIAVYEDTARHALAFTMEGRQYRISVPLKLDAKNREQETRRTWRLLVLLLKSKLEAVREGATTIEREFLADMVLPTGQTVSEWVGPQMALAYEKGQMPTALLLEGPR